MQRHASDWLSPMLVKEVHQGVRARLFTLGFVLVQAALASVALLVVVAADTEFATSLSGGLLWTILMAWLLAVVPMRALVALATETAEQTLELVIVTSLTPWRIVVGKWGSLMAQALLVAIVVLPYLVLRYFLAGINLAFELYALVLVVLASGAATAAMVLVSTLQSHLTRFATAFAGVLVTLFGLILFEFAPGMGPLGPSSRDLWVPVVVLGMLTALLLELASARIAPPAENHALRKRLGTWIALSGLLAVVGWAGRGSLDSDLYASLALVLLLLLGTDAAADTDAQLTVHYLPFARRGRVACWLARPLCPGWTNGVLFCCVTVPALVGTLDWGRGVQVEETVAHTLAMLASVLLPVAIARGIGWSADRPWLVAWIVHPVLAGLGVLLFSVVELVAGQKVPLLQCAPVVVSFGVWPSQVDPVELIHAYAALLAIEGLLLARPGWRELRQVAALERAAREHLAGSADAS